MYVDGDDCYFYFAALLQYEYKYIPTNLKLFLDECQITRILHLQRVFR